MATAGPALMLSGGSMGLENIRLRWAGCRGGGRNADRFRRRHDLRKGSSGPARPSSASSSSGESEERFLNCIRQEPLTLSPDGRARELRRNDAFPPEQSIDSNTVFPSSWPVSVSFPSLIIAFTG